MSSSKETEEERKLIIGLPRCGKTTIAGEGPHVTHTDDLIKKYEWSVFSDKVCDLLKRPGPWVIEGCGAVRGLRKYLKEGRVPDFEVVWLDKPYVPLQGRQIGFAASLQSIWLECQTLIKENKK